MVAFRCLAASCVLGAALLTGCRGQDKAIGLQFVPGQATHDPASAPLAVLTPRESHALPKSPRGQPIIGSITTKTSQRETAHILAAFPIAEWAQSALVGELRAAGINALESDGAKPGVPSVLADVTRMASDTGQHWSSTEVSAEVEMSFVVKGSGGTTEFSAKGAGKARSSQGVVLNCRDAYEAAMRDLLKTAVPRIVEAVR